MILSKSFQEFSGCKVRGHRTQVGLNLSACECQELFVVHGFFRHRKSSWKSDFKEPVSFCFKRYRISKTASAETVAFLTAPARRGRC
jgi:hypothetical protein